MALSSILTAKMKLSIKVNGFYLPFNQVIESWRRHCLPVLHYIDGVPGMDIGAAGSSLLLKHKGQLLQLFSLHQLENYNIAPEDVLIHRDELDQAKALGPSEIISLSADGVATADLDDIKILRYQSNQKPEVLDARFFRNDITAMANLESVDAEKVVLIFTVGFPLHNGKTEFDFDEDTHEFANVNVSTASTKLYLQQTPRIQKDPPHRIPLEVHDEFSVPEGYDFNGFSGAPVFFIHQDEDKAAHLGFAGMICEVLFDERLELYPGSIIQNILRNL